MKTRKITISDLTLTKVKNYIENQHRFLSKHTIEQIGENKYAIIGGVFGELHYWK